MAREGARHWTAILVTGDRRERPLCLCATVWPYASVRGRLLATACAGPDICKHRGSIRMRRSPRSPDRPTATYILAQPSSCAADCARTLRSPPARPRRQHAMRWHGALLAPDDTVAQHRDCTPRSPRSMSAVDTWLRRCVRADDSIEKPCGASGVLHDHPVAECHQACLVVTQESSEEVSGLGTCHIIGTVPPRRGHSKPRPRG